MTLTKDKIDRVAEITYDEAVAEIVKLSEVKRHTVGGTEVFAGLHPELGPIHIVLPVMGGGMLLLPFAIHNF
jgi:hypothetical protein